MFKIKQLLFDINYYSCISGSISLITKPLVFHKKPAEMQSNCFSSSTGPTNEEESEKDQVADIAYSKLFRFTKFVKMNELEPQEKLIHCIHISALQERKEVYTDPATGYDVLTRLAHLRRGNCCGNACRHCPYGHQKVPDNIPKKRFNSAFYV